MPEHSKGVRVTNCPTKQEYCYPSCRWWSKNGCIYDAYCQKELENNKAMKESSRLYRPDKRRDHA